MREQEFKEWARTKGYAERSVNTLLYDAKRTEKDDSVDLDEEFEKDELKSLIRLYSPTKQDEREGNIPKMKVVSKHKDKSLFDNLYGYRSTLKKYAEFRLSMGDDFVYEARDNDSDINASATFGLEKDLQSALVGTITQLEPDLTIVDGGVEYSVDSGRIDILAKDKDGCFVVIELKVGTAPDSVITQTLGYMADIADEHGQENVRGIIVADDFNKRVRSASRLIPNLTLISYRYTFEFTQETHNPK